MSVLIKGVSKSELMKALVQSTYFLPDDIEIIEVPTPHGGLIDGDELYSEVAKAHAYEHLSVKRIIRMVRNSSTVIEAEE
jgi:hypothetical protein